MAKWTKEYFETGVYGYTLDTPKGLYIVFPPISGKNLDRIGISGISTKRMKQYAVEYGYEDKSRVKWFNSKAKAAVFFKKIKASVK